MLKFVDSIHTPSQVIATLACCHQAEGLTKCYKNNFVYLSEICYSFELHEDYAFPRATIRMNKSFESHITLFTPYFTPSDAIRQGELEACLARNVANKHIGKIVLMIDDGASPSIDSKKIKIKNLKSRPTYADWIELIREFSCQGSVILANSDIYFDESIVRVNDILEDSNTLLALTRWEPGEDGLKRHPNPEWSQDTWAISSTAEITESMLARLNFALGVPRCDNKVAYVFATQGWKVRNPIHAIRSIHLHASPERSYDKRGDTRIVGGVAYVYPSDGLYKDSRLHFDIWSLRTHNVTEVSVNNNLEKWRKEDAGKNSMFPLEKDETRYLSDKRELSQKLSILRTGNKILSIAAEFAIYEGDIAFLLTKGTDPRNWLLLNRHEDEDLQAEEVLPRLVEPVLDFHVGEISKRANDPEDINFWQYPCLTEKQGFENHLHIDIDQNLNVAEQVLNIYVPLPWATYIDMKTYPDTLIEKLGRKVVLIRHLVETFGYSLKVHTVCQHIHWKSTLETMAQLGITDLSISHCEYNTQKEVLQLGSSITVHPWSLFAVNFANKSRSEGLIVGKPIRERKYLASFIGAHMNHYRTDVRLRMYQDLSELGHSDILVDLGKEWHFNKIVYNEQVANNKIDQDDVDHEREATVRYNQVLSNSKYALCPDGAGPNTLRFWEAIAVGSIPVLFDTSLKFPDLVDKELRALCLFWEKTRFGSEFHKWLSSFSDKELQTRSSKLREIYRTVESMTCF